MSNSNQNDCNYNSPQQTQGSQVLSKSTKENRSFKIQSDQVENINLIGSRGKNQNFLVDKENRPKLNSQSKLKERSTNNMTDTTFQTCQNTNKRDQFNFEQYPTSIDEFNKCPPQKDIDQELFNQDLALFSQNYALKQANNIQPQFTNQLSDDAIFFENLRKNQVNNEQPIQQVSSGINEALMEINKIINDCVTVRIFLYFSQPYLNNELESLILNQQESDNNIHYQFQYLDIEIPTFLTCRDLISQAIDQFNNKLEIIKFSKRLKPFYLNTIEGNASLYQLYMSNKRGQPKDEYPEFDFQQVVAQIKYQRFTLQVQYQALIQANEFENLTYFGMSSNTMTLDKDQLEKQLNQINVDSKGVIKEFPDSQIIEPVHNQAVIEYKMQSDQTHNYMQEKKYTARSSGVTKKRKIKGQGQGTCSGESCCTIF